jgi:AcrR family transcriptional regulator
MEPRARLVEAAERVMRSKGLARTTVKEIAREAGYSEGALYKHFSSKEELFFAVLADRLPPFIALSKMLPGRAGQGTVRETLTELASVAVAYYTEGFPIIASLFAEQEMLGRHREEMYARGLGPHRANEAVAAYLGAEQQLGRVRADTSPAGAAALLLGSCFQRAFLHHFQPTKEYSQAEEDQFVVETIDVVMHGIAPDDA